MNRMRFYITIVSVLFGVMGFAQTLTEYSFDTVELSLTKQKNDAIMCVAGPFTSVDGGIVGDYIINNKQYTGDEPNKNKTLGTLCIRGNEVRVFPSSLQRFEGEFCFHQICLVYKGKSRTKENANDMTCLRRAIGWKNAKKNILVEAENLTLHEFSKLLEKNGYQEAIYLDCGGWDYGWVKINGKTKTLGHSGSDEHFSNYLYFYKNKK